MNGRFLPRNTGNRSSLSWRALTLSLLILASFSVHRRQNMSAESTSRPHLRHRLTCSPDFSPVDAAELPASSIRYRRSKHALHTSRSGLRIITAWHSGQFVNSSLITSGRLSEYSVLDMKHTTKSWLKQIPIRIPLPHKVSAYRCGNCTKRRSQEPESRSQNVPGCVGHGARGFPIQPRWKRGFLIDF